MTYSEHTFEVRAIRAYGDFEVFPLEVGKQGAFDHLLQLRLPTLEVLLVHAVLQDHKTDAEAAIKYPYKNPG